MSDAWQVLSDCRFCLVEAAVVEMMDPHHPACHLGVPSEARCRLCGWSVEAAVEPFAPRLAIGSGRCPNCNKTLSTDARSGKAPCEHCEYLPHVIERQPPASIDDIDEALARLRVWAEEEGEPDLELFCGSNMGMSVDDVVRHLTTGEPVGTTFDVIAYLFPGAGGGAGHAPETRPKLTVGTAESAPEPQPAAPTMHPHTPARVLVSVMVADGELRDGEMVFITSYLEHNGLEPLRQSELRVWRPAELGYIAPELKEPLIEAAVHLMHLDREQDGTELKVIRAFARAWALPEAQVEGWITQYDRRYSTIMTRLWRSLTFLVR
jgi:hypothetical protein